MVGIKATERHRAAKEGREKGEEEGGMIKRHPIAAPGPQAQDTCPVNKGQSKAQDDLLST